MIFKKSPLPVSPLHAAINEAYRMDEAQCVEQRLAQATLTPEQLAQIEKTARQLVTEVRQQRKHKSGLDAFLYEYDLSSEEGVALMCLAEALLRVPDEETVHNLIRDKITSANWQTHLKKEGRSFFVNAATWGLMLTGKLLDYGNQNHQTLATTLQKFLERSSQPIIHNAIRQAMKILGLQFVMGRTIEEALQRSVKASKEKKYLYSFDMLGEAARTAEDAEHYFQAYAHAIEFIGQHNQEKNIKAAPGVSVKLSALHPRYEFSQREQLLPELIDRVKQLVLLAKKANISLVIDAEEADRLDLSLDVIEAIFTDKLFADWSGFGFAVQAYQKRAYPVIEWAIDLARQQKKQLYIRLIKGAYWDYEIKDSQVKGLEGYPVFTRKLSTDVSYIACAKKIMTALDVIYPQFGTHNAYTVAVIMELMGKNRNVDFEFQALHGMGYTLYDQLVAKENFPCRIYAPVGSHEDLLGYLVRRLLENGANTSFVNRIMDDQVPIENLIMNPVAIVKKYESKAHTKIALPENIFGKERKNSSGLDLSNIVVQQKINHEMLTAAKKQWRAYSLIGKKINETNTVVITNPANRQQNVGEVIEATTENVAIALQHAQAAAWGWNQTSVEQRTQYLEIAADLFEQHKAELLYLAIHEAGKNIFDAVNEVREAVDCCRYYAAQARKELIAKQLTGPTGEFNQLQMHGRGVTVCISPWNFPLAIFTGQVVAALVAGNPVIAKPAKQTPLIAMRAVELLHQAGIPKDVLQFLPGKAQIIGDPLIADQRVKNIILTGSTQTARSINQMLANREGAIATLIAETGGQNAMLVDSTALPEQVIVDVISSAFNSAGQRCSALRVLFLQDEIAEKIINMLRGAMAEIILGNPELLVTDVGPVIDEDARQKLQQHFDYLQQQNAKLIYQISLNSSCQQGTFFAPCAYEISSLKILKQEVFGPVLHVIRFKRENLDQMIEDINNTGYGLTLGIHTRINETVDYIQNRIRAGNAYVNRNMIGAVIGVQPFGGEGLSGTGPKTGGPHYLPRLCVERTLSINTAAAGGNASLMTLEE